MTAGQAFRLGMLLAGALYMALLWVDWLVAH